MVDIVWLLTPIRLLWFSSLSFQTLIFSDFLGVDIYCVEAQIGQEQFKSLTSAESYTDLAIGGNVTIQGNRNGWQGRSLNFVDSRGECVNYGKLKASVLNSRGIEVYSSKGSLANRTLSDIH